MLRRILFDNRWSGPQGIARFGDEIFKRLPSLIPLPLGMRLFHPLDPFWLSWTIRRLKPDIYFSPGFNPPVASPVPFVFMVYDLNYVQCPQNSDRLRRAYFNQVVRPACHRAAYVLTCSEYSRAQIVEWSRAKDERIINVGAGVGAEFSVAGAKYEPGFPYVLYVGNRLAHKNLPRLILAFAESKLDCKLVLTGEADPALKSYAAKAGIKDALHFAGKVSNEDLPALYRGALALALPSLYEGFGLPAVEAMACGVPALVSSSTSLPEVVADAALIVDACSVEEIAIGLHRLVSDSALRADMIRKGLMRARRYDWGDTVDAIEKVLDRV
jgi:glycosyltransferase involved in cell wall biosynthesis